MIDEREWSEAHEEPATLAAYLDHDYVSPPHVALLSQTIKDAVWQGGGRLLVSMPPRHGKSLLCSRWTPVWFLELFPKRRVLLASYGAQFAAEWGRKVRNTLRDHADRLMVGLAQDSKAVDHWNTVEGGGMSTAGVGGPLTGRGADLLIVDDPVKDSEEARSEVKREKVWEWWRETAYTRIEPGGTVIVIMTRWHEDDLVGRILANDGDLWHHLCLPALAEDDDPLGRAEGECLWQDRFDADDLASIRDRIGTHAFAALYQQRPAPLGGGMFRSSHFRYWRDEGEHYVLVTGTNADGGPVTHRVLKSQCRYIQTCDTAMTEKQTSDYTVIATFAITPLNHLLIVDLRRERLEVPDQWPFVRNAIADARKRPGYLYSAVEDKGSGVGLLQLGRKLGVPMRALKADRDKVTRATPASVWYENGMVYHPADAPWLADFEHELLSFPNGAHDDQVDVLAYAVIEARDKPSVQTPDPERPSLLERRSDPFADMVPERMTP